MNELILKAVKEKNGQPVTSSRKIAKIFEKQHKHVLRDIENIIEISQPKFGLPNVQIENTETIKGFTNSHFQLASYKSRGKAYPEYILDKDGFSLLAMGYNGVKAMKFKIDYINAFNKMAKFIKSLEATKLEFPAFTNAIMEAHEEPKNYHYSNEINMINKIVLGVTASQFKKANGIDKNVQSIRPYLNQNQIASVEMLQRIDIGLIITIPNYHERKKILTDYYNNNMIVRLPA